jgi:hypothetical protein
MKTLLLAAVLGSCGFVLSACGGKKVVEPSPGCPGGRTEPLTREAMEAALSKHGIKLYSKRDSGMCSAWDIQVLLTNYDTTAYEEGLIDCVLRIQPIYRRTKDVHGHWALTKDETPGYKTKYILANSECSIYPKGARGRKQALNLFAALNELEQKLRQKDIREWQQT